MTSPLLRPITDADNLDRRIVRDAVRLVGHQRLRFTLDDLREAVEAHPVWRLSHPRQLSRHVAALVPLTLQSVGQPLAAFEPEGHPRGKTRHLYVLTERLEEHRLTPLSWTEAARVYVALWVAARALQVEAVETLVVTRVCQAIPYLSVGSGQHMAMRLKALANRATPMVAMVEPTSREDGAQSRWVRWQPIGRDPEHPDLDTWVATVRALGIDRDATGVGYATAHDLLIDLVAIAVRQTKSTTWPAGQSVTVEDIDAACAEDRQARELRKILDQRGTTVGRVLGDASKARIAGANRFSRRVVKVGAVSGGRTFYDAPALPGYEQRAMIVPYLQLHTALRRHEREALSEEWRQAARLGSALTSTPRAGRVCKAMASVRVLLLHRQLDTLETMAGGLLDLQHNLSSRVIKSVRRELDSLARARASLRCDSAEAYAIALGATEEVGVALDPILEAERPLLLGDEYIGWVPASDRKSYTGPELLARATMLERFPNPRHTNRRDPDPVKAAVTGVDRVNALIHLAERSAARTLTFLQGGRELLGSTLRDGALPTLLLDAGDDRLWARALAALVLLGSERAAEVACGALRQPTTPGHRLVLAMYALSVLGHAEDCRTWPDHLWQSRDPQVIDAVRVVMTSASQGRRLL